VGVRRRREMLDRSVAAQHVDTEVHRRWLHTNTAGHLGKEKPYGAPAVGKLPDLTSSPIAAPAAPTRAGQRSPARAMRPGAGITDVAELPPTRVAQPVPTAQSNDVPREGPARVESKSRSAQGSVVRVFEQVVAVRVVGGLIQRERVVASPLTSRGWSRNLLLERFRAHGYQIAYTHVSRVNV